MRSITMNPFLRGALAIDAAASGALGVLMAWLPARLAGLFNLPEAMLFEVGLFFVVYAAFVTVLATRERLPAWLVWIVIAGNALWAVQSVAVLAAGWVTPSALGTAFVLAQAVAVVVFAELQFIGMRRARALAAA